MVQPCQALQYMPTIRTKVVIIMMKRIRYPTVYLLLKTFYMYFVFPFTC